MLRRLEMMRIPPVCLFWVMVVNLPPPVPRNTISVLVMFCTIVAAGEQRLLLLLVLSRYKALNCMGREGYIVCCKVV